MELVDTYSSLPISLDDWEKTNIDLTGGARPSGLLLVHNHVVPARRSGTHGFRFWLQPPGTGVIPCHCGWRPEIGDHYRIERPRTA